MKEEIVSNLANAAALEALYRKDKATFKREFNALFPEPTARGEVSFWQQRLNYRGDEANAGTRSEWLFIIVASLLSGAIAKLPLLLHIEEEYFYQRNIGFIVFPALTAFFAWKNKLAAFPIAIICGATIISLVFINLLPHNPKSDTLLLSCIHLLLLLWAVLYYAFAGGGKASYDRKLGYLRYNGDLVVMTTLILIAGFILSGVSIGLFSIIGLNIEAYYFDYVGIFGLVAAPIVGTYLTQSNPQLVGKVSPVIASIFSPLVLLMLIIYLVAILYSGKDPYNDREFLLLFNGLLIGVMAIIFFSVAESAKTTAGRMKIWILFLLSAVTIVVNGVALSAILFRISEWGFTPNRIAVLGGNVLILINLLFVTAQLYKVLSRKRDVTAVGNAIISYLPVYIIWALIVTFLFPFLFSFS